MLVSELTSKKVITVNIEDKLSIVKEIFKSMKIHHLLVVANNKVFGVVCDRDLYKALSPNIDTLTETLKDRVTFSKQVYQIVTRHPTTLPPTSTMGEVIEIFSINNFSCIPRVDSEMKPLGIITIRDSIKALNNKTLIL